MEWTTEAKQALHEYVQKATSQPPTSDAYQDLYSDLRAHVEEDHHQNDTQGVIFSDVFMPLFDSKILSSDYFPVKPSSEPYSLHFLRSTMLLAS